MTRARARSAAALGGVALALALGCACAAPAPATVVVPVGFDDVLLASGLNQPTAADWGPDGRIYVAEKAGRVRVVEPDGRLRPQPLLDISDHVNSYWDRGMTDVELAADFASTGHVYLLYVADRDPAHPDGAKAAVLTRVTVAPDGTIAGGAEPETTILGGGGAACPPDQGPAVDCLPVDWGVHGTGTVISDPDGSLWVSLGDGKESGAVLSPLTFRPFDPALPSGKVLHVDASGHGLTGHPFCPGETDLSKTCTKVFARGLRNPFRIAPLAAGGLLVGDVGWEQTEELDAARGGESFGWPCREGDHAAPSYTDLAGCAQGVPPPATAPVHTYAHNVGSSILAGPVYDGASWPSGYVGRSFFADTISGALWTIAPADTGAWPVTAFGSGLGFPVDLAMTPDGDLAYVSFGAGELRAIRWAPDNRTPHAVAAASATYGPVPLAVTFDAAGSFDPDDEPLSYAWDFGDGASATGPVVGHTYVAEGLYTARLTVTDPHGATAAADLLIGPGNDPPSLEVTAPADGARYRIGETIALAATATDAQDGVLPAAGITWDIVLRHGEHSHPLIQRHGSVSSFTTLASHGAGSHYEVTVTAVDAGGLTASRTLVLEPRLAPVSLTSSPPGAALDVGRALRHRAGELRRGRRLPAGGERARDARARRGDLPLRELVGRRRAAARRGGARRRAPARGALRAGRGLPAAGRDRLDREWGSARARLQAAAPAPAAARAHRARPRRRRRRRVAPDACGLPLLGRCARAARTP